MEQTASQKWAITTTVLNMQLWAAQNGWSYFLRVERQGWKLFMLKTVNTLQHLHRTSDLKDTRQCGLNLGGPIAGRLSVHCRTEILFGFDTMRNIYWLAKEHLLKNPCSVKSVKYVKISAIHFVSDYYHLSKNFHGQVKRSVIWGEIAWRFTVVIRYTWSV